MGLSEEGLSVLAIVRLRQRGNDHTADQRQD
jgi:hypothetical protein